eukprot:CAMPEP_0201990080 /NCGR_PEP_ID=MMETSP0904-20121228/93185_1 /ASSEMBLY_ACC=CAM_ASM_000553 /TAXON_ID=420261 /ORGANISM="Thalassiosira antarctica, Strain CCMP982" /LENGTH=690 /DNA_ID=CAMNT_0048544329 /DNA_START=1005 /DNA_END=3074 /DNA_ORIENTATION=-
MFIPNLTVQALSIMGLLVVAPPVAGQDTRRRLGKPQNLFTRPADDGPASKGKGKGKTLPFGKLSNKSVPSVDRGKVEAEDAEREATRQPKRFAIVNEVNISPANDDGTWEVLEDGTQVWRYRVKSPGCNSLNFSFCDYNMPEGGNKLFIYDTKGGISLPRSFTSKDNAGESLWTPIIESCDVIIEVNLDAKTSPEDLVLSLCAANVGYRGFGTRKEAQHGKPRRRELSGGCNNDVICPVGDDWRDEISSVAAYSLGGSLFCTGAMINNARQDGKPYFLTAHHCGVTSSNADSLVVYWNYETSICGGTPDGNLAFSTEGAIFKATSEVSDFTLVELDEKPDAAWGVNYAGWDRSGAHCGVRANNAESLVVYWNYETSICGGEPDGNLSKFTLGATFKATSSLSDFTLVQLASKPNAAWGVNHAGWDRSGADASSAVAIHHPGVDEKRISFENDATTKTYWGGNAVQTNAAATHVRVIDWDDGTTEGGSSGSPLFDQNHHIIGQLHGGGAACGNDKSDWYGRFYKSWTGENSDDTRLSTWLDPGNSGVIFVGMLGGDTVSPTEPITLEPTSSPSKSPTVSPTEPITPEPTSSPSKSPTVSPTEPITPEPTSSPSKSPTVSPTEPVTPEPTSSPLKSPTVSPTEAPTGHPTKLPNKSPTASPTEAPTATIDCESIGNDSKDKKRCKATASCVW